MRLESKNYPLLKRMPTSLFSKVKPQAIAIWARQLSVLMLSGVPLVAALEVLIKQERNKAFKDTLVQVAFSVRSGMPFLRHWVGSLSFLTILSQVVFRQERKVANCLTCSKP